MNQTVKVTPWIFLAVIGSQRQTKDIARDGTAQDCAATKKMTALKFKDRTEGEGSI